MNAPDPQSPATSHPHQARLFITAAPLESAAVCRAFAPELEPPTADWQLLRLPSGDDLVQSGVGKVNAALCVARFLDTRRHVAILNLGICGVLPALPRATTPQPALAHPALAQAVLADRSVYADEGVVTPKGFQSISRCGFPPGGWPTPSFLGDAIINDAALAEALVATLAHHSIPVHRGPIATVSTCSGTNAFAHAVVARTGAIAEAMEGAAIAHAVSRLTDNRLPFAELRTISNTAGDRDQQVWNVKAACETLTNIVRVLCQEGSLADPQRVP